MTQPGRQPASQDAGITAEESLALNPPAPRRVRQAAGPGGIRLEWNAPPLVTEPHTYSDRVVGFRVYRRVDRQLDFRPLAVTQRMDYLDRSAEPGHTYAYVVSSIHERHVEGTRSDPPVVVRLPAAD